MRDHKTAPPSAGMHLETFWFFATCTVQLPGFRIGLHPVTNADYAAFVHATGAAAPATADHPLLSAPDRPVVGVSYAEALAYCAWAGGSLPTEAQWELAARGFDGRRYHCGESSPDDSLACFARDWVRGGPAPIGSRPAGVSSFGCHDMAGSVWEWCLDVFHDDAHVERCRQGVDPCVAGEGRVRPLRGGCWRSIERKLQSTYRNWTHELARNVIIGFRLCMPGRGSLTRRGPGVS
ncbi:MAG: formylglycine-generating enzyme family protein [Myxococcota bacterium]